MHDCFLSVEELSITQCDEWLDSWKPIIKVKGIEVKLMTWCLWSSLRQNKNMGCNDIIIFGKMKVIIKDD